MKKASHNNTAQALADNLNRNVMLEHIKEVENGNRPKDSDYLRFIGIREHLSSLQAFQEWKYGKQKSNRMQTALAVLGVILMFILAAGLFYWYELRPSAIRRDCEAYANSQNAYDYAESNNFYRICLLRNGMKPESMFVNTD